MSHDYTTTKGNAFSFIGFNEGESISEFFMRGEYLKAAHAASFVLGTFCHPEACKMALEDDGIVHELIHLALGIDQCTHTLMGDLMIECMRLDAEATKQLKNMRGGK